MGKYHVCVSLMDYTEEKHLNAVSGQTFLPVKRELWNQMQQTKSHFQPFVYFLVKYATQWYDS